jgi:hypothetical protein
MIRKKPRYTNRKWLTGAKRWAYYFTVPSWARERGCKVEDKALGMERDPAYDYAETVLLPQFDSWRTAGLSDLAEVRGAVGTFDWMVPLSRPTRSIGSSATARNAIMSVGLTWSRTMS